MCFRPPTGTPPPNIMFCKSTLYLSLLIGAGAVFPGIARAQSEQAINKIRHAGVETSDGRNLGHIREMSIDLGNGRILEVFVLTGDFLGFGGRIIPVPPSALTPKAGENVYQLDMNRADFRQAPSIKRTSGGGYQDRTRVQASYRYFGKEAEFDESDFAQTSDANTAEAPLDQVIRSSKLINMPILNQAHEKVGRVQAITYFVTSGTVENIKMAEAKSSATTSVLRPSALRLNAARTALILTDSLNAVDAAPNSQLIEQRDGQDAYYRVLPSNDQTETNKSE